MKFENITVSEALGWTLAHSVNTSDTRLLKNSQITTEVIQQLQAAHIHSVLAYKLEDGDIDENAAAKIVAQHIAGAHVRIGKPTRGRCNLYAKKSGLMLPDKSIDALNAMGPAIGTATLPKYAPVTNGKLVATVKIIPYGLAKTQLNAVTAINARLSITPFNAFNAAILTSGAVMSVKAESTTKNRINGVSGTVVSIKTCAHTVPSVSDKIIALTKTGIDLLILSGISAISDVRDVLPAALKAAGGQILHLGMPVDPGNLLMLGKHGSTIIIGMPGCAKSPSLNGFDWVLERYAAGLPLDANTLQGMGVGGLLKEVIERPEPRAPSKPHAIKGTPAIILAAGKSTRSGNNHKLLAVLDGKPVITQSVIALKDAGIKGLHVVTGARADEIREALKPQHVNIVHNALYETGMASSLAAGITALPPGTEQCFICLGDMPFVNKTTYSALIAAANRVSEAQIFVPLFKGKRGNPVLWRNSQFEKLVHIKGDKGGRDLIKEQENLVCAVPVDDPGILIDLDTPEALAQFGIRVTK